MAAAAAIAVVLLAACGNSGPPELGHKGLHCVDDSPLFIAVWYTIAVGMITGLGAFLGSRLLKW